ncbi:MAG: efflux RND transporter periplasmic adaptor subunit [Deltaproteobacteria bacterium]|nr:efflux RND transporter periplasmic adaptor subunit [Deltaproteobacteria bacterium]
MTSTIRLLALLVAFLAAAGGCHPSSENDARVTDRPEVAPDAHGGGAHDHDAHGDDARGDGAHDHDEGGGHVRLTAEQMQAFGVAVSTAGPGTVDVGIDLPGSVRPNGDRLAHIVPRFPGIVQEVRKTIGDPVRTGDVLAVVESSESLAPYALTTLMDGTVIEKHLTRGEAVDRDKQAFVIADLSTVWIDCSVFQKDLDRVGVGTRVRVSAGSGGPEAEGAISYVTPVLDQPTRTATARVVLANQDGRWRPGMFVTVRILAPLDVAVAVPPAALQSLANEQVVFVETAEGFVPRVVRVGRAAAEAVEILAGLAPGERYISANAFLAKAELGKGSAEHAH